MGEGCPPSSVLPEVAVVRVNETHAGDSSRQESPCAT